MKKIRFSVVLVCVALAGMLVLVVRQLAAGPAYAPRAADVSGAGREALPPPGTADARAPLPEGAIVGGGAVVEPAEREARLAGASPGVVSVIRVKEGDHVSPGDVLVELESSVEAAAVASAEAEVASAKATFARALNGQRVEDRDAAAAESASARSRADLSAAALARAERLFAGGAMTAEELDKARLGAAADRATADAAEARARAARAGSRGEDVAVARAAQRAAEARLEQARATLARRQIRAPYAGEILQVKARVGEHYTPGASEAPVVLGDTSRLRARMDVDERDLGKVRPGQRAFVLADAWPGRRFGGRVVEIGRRMGRKNVRTDEPTERIDTKVLEVVVELDDGRELVPGLRVTGYVEIGAPQG